MPTDDNPEYLYCSGRFMVDLHGEPWIQCKNGYTLFVAGIEENDTMFTCEFCKKRSKSKKKSSLFTLNLLFSLKRNVVSTIKFNFKIIYFSFYIWVLFFLQFFAFYLKITTVRR